MLKVYRNLPENTSVSKIKEKYKKRMRNIGKSGIVWTFRCFYIIMKEITSNGSHRDALRQLVFRKKEGFVMPSRKVRLEIGGSSYVVSTNDSEEYLLGLAERLDRDMNQIMVETPNASVAAAAVITALGYLDESERSAFGADNMRAQIQDYLEDAAKAKMAAEEAKREVERLRLEVARYEKKEKKAKPAETKESASVALDEEKLEDVDELQMGLDEL